MEPLSDDRLARDLLDATFGALSLTRLSPARLRAITTRSLEAANQSARAMQQRDPGAEPGTYARALATWYREGSYLDSDGAPAALPIAGPRPSVHALLRSVGLRRGIEAAAERLIRSGAIVLQSDGRALPVSRAMAYAREPDLALRHFVEGVQRFVQTVRFNTSLPGLQAPLFEQSAIVRNLPAEDVESFRQFIAAVGFSTVNTIDDWLESRVTAAARRRRRGAVQPGGRLHVRLRRAACAGAGSGASGFGKLVAQRTAQDFADVGLGQFVAEIDSCAELCSR